MIQILLTLLKYTTKNILFSSKNSNTVHDMTKLNHDK